ncbi:MAG: zonular occludens toxin domain-containing protein [Gammaproteobacteria bacterium]
MSVYFVTGKLGNGKTLCCVGKIRNALRAGVRVATNVELNLQAFGFKKPVQFDRVADFPSAEQLNALGQGQEGPYNEETFGLLVLDECARWLNARDWNDKSRRALIDWCIHARKKRWHVYLIVQDISLVDKQVLEIMCEHVVTCRRLDRIRFAGFRLPKAHVATVWYGDRPRASNAFRVEQWLFRGTDLFDCYDTTQVFGPVTENRVVAWSPEPVVKFSPFTRPLRSSGFNASAEHFVIRHGVGAPPRPRFLVVDGGYCSFLSAQVGLSKPRLVVAGAAAVSSKRQAA